MVKITRAGFLAIATVGVLAVGGLVKLALGEGWLGKPTDSVAVVPVATSVPHFNVPEVHAPYQLPATAAPARMASCPVMEVLAWNAIGGLSLANGGETTARGSLVEKYTGGGCLALKRQDDYSQMEANMAAFVSSGGTRGDAFFVIMGDGYPYVAAALEKLIPGQYSAVGVIGFSDGEDKCMLPSSVQRNPREAIKSLGGVLVAAVPRDGDWNICVKWASDNGVPVNVDQKTFDRTAINFMDVDMFTTADEKLIARACEDRTVVEGGIAHGTERVCVNGVATWTPGDVDVVEKFDGSIVSVASTHDYAGQMPALVIGAKSWMREHHDYVVGLLRAADRGAMAVRSDPGALATMGAIHAQVFREKDGAFWARLYRGEVGRNHAGETVNLGGSKVIVLQEARDYFGLREGTENVFASVYRVFKAYDESFYPTLYPRGSIPAYEDAVDAGYLRDALAGVPETRGAVAPQLAVAAPITRSVSRRTWHVEFDSGSAVIRPESLDQLYQIEDTAAMTDLRIRLDGYTDNTGSASRNVELSAARAEAVAGWLHGKAPANFPLARMEARGHGPAEPACPENNTPDCRAQNRRVEITLGQ